MHPVHCQRIRDDFAITLGAQLFNSFLAITQMPRIGRVDRRIWIFTNDILLVMLLTYLIFGCIMDSLI